MIARGDGSDVAPVWTPEQLVGPGRCAACGGALPLERRRHRLTCSVACRQRWGRLRKLPYHQAAARVWGFSPSDCWRTPPEVVADAATRLRVRRFELDAAALPLDAVAERSIGPWLDGRAQPWGPGPTWCNPPYSRLSGGLDPWARKARAEAARGVPVALLLPASVSAGWFGDLVDAGAQVVIYERRLSFIPPPGEAAGGARHDSALFLFGRVKSGIIRADRPTSGGRRAA